MRRLCVAELLRERLNIDTLAWLACYLSSDGGFFRHVRVRQFVSVGLVAASQLIDHLRSFDDKRQGAI